MKREQERVDRCNNRRLNQPQVAVVVAAAAVVVVVACWYPMKMMFQHSLSLFLRPQTAADASFLVSCCPWFNKEVFVVDAFC